MRHRKSKEQSNTNADYQRQLKRTTFYLERSFGGHSTLEDLRAAGLNIETHEVRFRHNTEDVDWLLLVGEKKWIPLMADLEIGRNPLEMDALLAGKVRAFVVVKEDGAPHTQYTESIIIALPQIFRMLEEIRYPFIAKVYKDGSVFLWKTEPIYQKGRRSKKRYRPRKRDLNRDGNRI